MKKLHLRFVNATGNKHTLIPKVAADNLTAQEARTAMMDIVQLGLFEKDNVPLYTAIDSAKYVETIETELF